MIGIQSSNLVLRLMVIACTASGMALADEIALTGRDKLSGTIRSIDGSGVVELATPISPDTIFLKAGSVEKVQFSSPVEGRSTPGAMVGLVNGDLIPASIESLDDKSLTIATQDAGRLVLPRETLKTLQLGIQKRKVIYSGPKSMEEWAGDSDGARNWKFENNALVASGPAFVSKSFETPQQFVVRFTLKWEGNPNFQIYFADPLKPRGEVSDRYYMQFNGAGIELKRESSKGNRYTTVVLLSNRTPDVFADNKVDVEIRVNRKASRLHILLNGEPEGAGIDPISGAPSGKGVSLVSNSASGSEQEIRGLEILEFDDARIRHRSEDRGNPKTDSLISRDDDRWGGHLQAIKQTNEGLVFSFKSDFQDEPLELLDSDVSTVFFANSDGTGDAGVANPFILRLQDHGSLRVTSCSFNETIVKAVHPLLGELSIQRSGIVALERPDAKPRKELEK
jgi:hypothetical protein